MHNIACSGYVVPADKLDSLLPKHLRKQFLEKLDNLEGESVEDLFEWFCESAGTDKDTLPSEFFKLSTEDESDDLELGTIYAYFGESDLFVLKPSAINKKLARLNIIPKRSYWTVWG